MQSHNVDDKGGKGLWQTMIFKCFEYLQIFMNLRMNSPYFCWLYDLTFKAVASHLILPQQIILVVLYKNVLKYILIKKEEKKYLIKKKIHNSVN